MESVSHLRTLVADYNQCAVEKSKILEELSNLHLQIVSGIPSIHTDRARQKAVCLKREYMCAELAWLTGELQRLETAILALLHNGYKYSGEK